MAMGSYPQITGEKRTGQTENRFLTARPFAGIRWASMRFSSLSLRGAPILRPDFLSEFRRLLVVDDPANTALSDLEVADQALTVLRLFHAILSDASPHDTHDGTSALP